MTHSSSLFPIINGLRHCGVGTKVTRSIYKFPQTYWILTRVKLSVKDQTHGKAWGRMFWRGRPKPVDQKIGGTLKNQWFLVQLPDYQKFRGTSEELSAMIEEDKQKHAQEAVSQTASQ